MGDFNTDLLKIDAHTDSQKFIAGLPRLMSSGTFWLEPIWILGCHESTRLSDRGLSLPYGFAVRPRVSA